MIVAGTGHRSDKVGGYTHFARHRLMEFAMEQLTAANLKPTDTIISGMALGWDTALAQAAVQLSVPFIAAVPCPEQDRRWNGCDRAMYAWLLGKAKEVVIVSSQYGPGVMDLRNQWMVEHADWLLALFDGSSGGTKNCIAYAKFYGKPYKNVWQEWCLKAQS